MEFRAAHGSEFRAYARRLRGMVREIGELPTEERTRVLDDRGDPRSGRSVEAWAGASPERGCRRWTRHRGRDGERNYGRPARRDPLSVGSCGGSRGCAASQDRHALLVPLLGRSAVLLSECTGHRPKHPGCTSEGRRGRLERAPGDQRQVLDVSEPSDGDRRETVIAGTAFKRPAAARAARRFRHLRNDRL